MKKHSNLEPLCLFQWKFNQFCRAAFCLLSAFCICSSLVIWFCTFCRNLHFFRFYSSVLTIRCFEYHGYYLFCYFIYLILFWLLNCGYFLRLMDFQNGWIRMNILLETTVLRFVWFDPILAVTGVKYLCNLPGKSSGMKYISSRYISYFVIKPYCSSIKVTRRSL